MGITALIMGIATAFNILVIFKKIELKRIQDALFDLTILTTLSIALSGTLGGMLVATVASAIVSIYFMFNPPKIIPTLHRPEWTMNKKARKRARKLRKAL